MAVLEIHTLREYILIQYSSPLRNKVNPMSVPVLVMSQTHTHTHTHTLKLIIIQQTRYKLKGKSITYTVRCFIFSNQGALEIELL